MLYAVKPAVQSSDVVTVSGNTTHLVLGGKVTILVSRSSRYGFSFFFVVLRHRIIIAGASSTPGWYDYHLQG